MANKPFFYTEASMMDKKLLLENNWEIVGKLESEYSLLDYELNLRGLKTQAERREYVEAPLSKLHSAFLFKDMEKAVARIKEALAKREKILIFGDYDCDGMTATALLLRFFRFLDYEVDYFVPDRLKDPYGLSLEQVEMIEERGTSLVITVDNGASSAKAIQALKDKGIDVIITDHHIMDEEAEAALAIINPNYFQENYPEKRLAGVGVAFKLATALAESLDLDQAKLNSLLPLVALGTLADMVDLAGESRIYVKAGLELMRDLDILGLALMANNLAKERELDATACRFYLVPQINAAARLGQCELAMQVLLSDDPQELEDLIDHLASLNEERKALSQRIYKEAQAQISEAKLADIILVVGTNWQMGVLGLVASSLSRAYQRPAIVLSQSDTGIYKGSARSYADIHLYESLEPVKDLCLSIGGHAAALGLSIAAENLEIFQEKIIAIDLSDFLSPQKELRAIHELEQRFLNLANAEALLVLEPFGDGNEESLYLARGAKLLNWRKQGDNLFLNFELGQKLEVIAFKLAYLEALLQVEESYDLVFRLKYSLWGERPKLQLHLVDLKLAARQEHFFKAEAKYQEGYDVEKVGLACQITVADLTPLDRHFADVYTFLHENFADLNSFAFSPAVLAFLISKNLSLKVTAFILLRILEIFAEAGFLKLEQKAQNFYQAGLIQVSSKKSLKATKAYKHLYQV